MDALIAFAVATIVSFWGSLQLGLVNVAVIETTLVRGGKNGLMLAIGGVLPEIPYTLLAIYGAEYIGDFESSKDTIAAIIGSVLIAIGLFYFFKKAKARDIQLETPKYAKTGAFAKGFGLALLNPQLIFFWSGILILLETGSLNIFKEKEKLIDFSASGWISPKWSFAIGAAFGALLILSVYIYLARRFRDKIPESLNAKLNKLVGLFFIGLGLFSILKYVV